MSVLPSRSSIISNSQCSALDAQCFQIVLLKSDALEFFTGSWPPGRPRRPGRARAGQGSGHGPRGRWPCSWELYQLLSLIVRRVFEGVSYWKALMRVYSWPILPPWALTSSLVLAISASLALSLRVTCRGKHVSMGVIGCKNGECGVLTM